MNTSTSRPGAQGVKVDLQLARKIYPSLAPEVAQISNYIYYNIMFNAPMLEVAEVFDFLAVEGTDHFRQLGDLILALGANPALHLKVRNTPVDMVGGDNTDERGVEELKLILPHLIDTEAKASKEYARLAGEASDNPGAKMILERLSSAESGHADTLLRVLSSINE